MVICACSDISLRRATAPYIISVHWLISRHLHVLSVQLRYYGGSLKRLVLCITALQVQPTKATLP